MHIHLTINGQKKRIEVRPGDILLDVLRKEGYQSIKKGCGLGECGACAVLLDNRPVNSCLVLAADADGSEITTAEGLGTPDKPHFLQEAFVKAGAVQCGYCTPGMIISAKALLDRNPRPSTEEIKKGLDGNYCRCTGYVKIIDAVRQAALKLKRS
ncbi:MAG: (2Fe-2S)-binding protein [bacterium]|nr:(2Fe-2S)-binding protein [bacterium]